MKEPNPIPRSFLRGCEPSLVNLCPRFSNTIAPILFHLPDRTISRILETIPPHLVGLAFVFNGRVKFGLDVEAVKSTLPRWSATSDGAKAKSHMTQLCEMACRNAIHIPENLLSETIRVTGSLREADILSEQAANELLRAVLPICLDKLALSRQDVFNIVYGLNRIQITEENAVLFPLVANFAQWFLGRSQVNRLKRSQKVRVKQRIDTFISS